MKTFTIASILTTFCCSWTLCFANETEEATAPTSNLEAIVQKIVSESGVGGVRYFDKIGLLEMVLDNGMRVWLKPTTFDSDEVVVSVAALGGYASFEGSDPLDGELAVQYAVQSGFNSLDNEKFSSFLHDHALEFEPKIDKFSRAIYALAEAKELPALMECVEKVFTSPRFTEKGWGEALILTKESASKLIADDEYLLEQAFLRANTQNSSLFRPISLESIRRAYPEKSKELFRKCFNNPADFVCVIVGTYDIVQVAQQAKQHLGKIPKGKPADEFKKGLSASFPNGITQEVVKTRTHQQGMLTHLSFPLQVTIDEKSIHQVAFACQIIEANLRRVITNKMKISYGVDVSYEFPLFPFRQDPWISIRFGTDEKTIQTMLSLVLDEIRRLQREGAMEGEIEMMKKLEAGSQDYWLHDNLYWGTMLTNYYYWGWNPEGIDYKNTGLMDYTKTTLNPFLAEFISLENYGVFSAKG